MKPDFSARRRKLARLMKGKKLGACLLTDPDDVLYYSGFRGLSDDRPLLLVPLRGRPTLLLCPLINEAKTRCRVVHVEKREDILRVLRPYKRVGYDERSFYAKTFSYLRGRKVRLVPAGMTMKKPRLVKEPWEIRQIRKAIEITGKVLSRVTREMYGKTEEEVANMIKARTYLEGAEPAFDPIVSSGPQTGIIHHKPNSRRIRKSDMILIDLGCRVNGYCSDITRMFGKTVKGRKMIEDLKVINIEMIRRLKPGVRVKDLDSLHDELFRALGYKVRHRFGHGVGLSVHEETGDVLEEGMVITMEPGIYRKGIGARLENMILIKKGGYGLLSKSV